MGLSGSSLGSSAALLEAWLGSGLALTLTLTLQKAVLFNIP